MRVVIRFDAPNPRKDGEFDSFQDEFHAYSAGADTDEGWYALYLENDKGDVVHVLDVPMLQGKEGVELAEYVVDRLNNAFRLMELE